MNQASHPHAQSLPLDSIKDKRVNDGINIPIFAAPRILSLRHIVEVIRIHVLPTQRIAVVIGWTSQCFCFPDRSGANQLWKMRRLVWPRLETRNKNLESGARESWRLF